MSQAMAFCFSLIYASAGTGSLVGIVNILLPAVSLCVVPLAVEPACLKELDL
jgi:hypothetical protein